MKDVIVIGGGPVGLHAARCLAADGFDIEVLEEHESFGEPVHCTGILAPEVFEEFRIPSSVALNELRTVRFYSPRGQVVRYRTDRVEAVVVNRCAFDRALSDLACAGGAKILSGIRAEKIKIGDTGVMIDCSKEGPRKARACIIATGSSYMLTRSLGIESPPVYLNCAQMELPVEHPGDVEIRVGNELAPKGFAWAVPVQRDEGRFARVGVMCDGNAAQHFERLLPRLHEWRIKSIDHAKPMVRILPLAPIPKTYGNRFLIAGDAAGLVKPTTGGGVYYGLVSAGIAARVLADALRRDSLRDSDLSRYQDLWQERLMEEIEAQQTLRLLLQRLSDDELDSIFDLWLTDGLMPLIRKTANFNEHKRLIMAVTRYPAMRKILFRKVLT